MFKQRQPRLQNWVYVGAFGMILATGMFAIGRQAIRQQHAREELAKRQAFTAKARSEVKVHRSLSVPIGVHNSLYMPAGMSVLDRKFKDVAGFPPYYLELPEIDSVLFVTQSPATIHVANLKTRQLTSIKTPYNFGRGICEPGLEADSAHVMAGTNGETLIIAERYVYPHTKQQITINLGQQRIQGMRFVDLDGNDAENMRPKDKPKIGL
jgi:hypothetical protein